MLKRQQREGGEKCENRRKRKKEERKESVKEWGREREEEKR